MLAINFNECSYAYRRGRNKGAQCCKNTDTGICQTCSKNRCGNLNINLLIENIIAINTPMIAKCIDTFIYSYDEIFNGVLFQCNSDVQVKMVIKTWLKSKSQHFFIIKYWLFSALSLDLLISDVIDVINKFYYHLQYEFVINDYKNLYKLIQI